MYVLVYTDIYMRFIQYVTSRTRLLWPGDVYDQKDLIKSKKLQIISITL